MSLLPKSREQPQKKFKVSMLQDETYLKDIDQSASKQESTSHFHKFSGYQKAVEDQQLQIRDFAQEERNKSTKIEQKMSQSHGVMTSANPDNSAQPRSTTRYGQPPGKQSGQRNQSISAKINTAAGAAGSGNDDIRVRRNQHSVSRLHSARNKSQQRSDSQRGYGQINQDRQSNQVQTQ